MGLSQSVTAKTVGVTSSFGIQREFEANYDRHSGSLPGLFPRQTRDFDGSPTVESTVKPLRKENEMIARILDPIISKRKLQKHIYRKFPGSRHDFVEEAASCALNSLYDEVRFRKVKCLVRFFESGQLTCAEERQFLTFARLVAYRTAIRHYRSRNADRLVTNVDFPAIENKSDVDDEVGTKPMCNLLALYVECRRQLKAVLEPTAYLAIKMRLRGESFASIGNVFEIDRNKASAKVHGACLEIGRLLNRRMPPWLYQRFVECLSREALRFKGPRPERAMKSIENRPPSITSAEIAMRLIDYLRTHCRRKRKQPRLGDRQ